MGGLNTGVSQLYMSIVLTTLEFGLIIPLTHSCDALEMVYPFVPAFSSSIDFRKNGRFTHLVSFLGLLLLLETILPTAPIVTCLGVKFSRLSLVISTSIIVEHIKL